MSDVMVEPLLASLEQALDKIRRRNSGPIPNGQKLLRSVVRERLADLSELHGPSGLDGVTAIRRGLRLRDAAREKGAVV